MCQIDAAYRVASVVLQINKGFMVTAVGFGRGE